MSNEKRFPIKADTKGDAYLQHNRVKGSIPWEDAIPVIERWYPRFRNLGEDFSQAMARLANQGGLDHKTMDGFAAKHYDHMTDKKHDYVFWRKNFVEDTSDSEKHSV